jgi:hypothetical protein
VVVPCEISAAQVTGAQRVTHVRGGETMSAVDALLMHRASNLLLPTVRRAIHSIPISI